MSLLNLLCLTIFVRHQLYHFVLVQNVLCLLIVIACFSLAYYVALVYGCSCIKIWTFSVCIGLLSIWESFLRHSMESWHAVGVHVLSMMTTPWRYLQIVSKILLILLGLVLLKSDLKWSSVLDLWLCRLKSRGVFWASIELVRNVQLRFSIF